MSINWKANYRDSAMQSKVHLRKLPILLTRSMAVRAMPGRDLAVVWERQPAELAAEARAPLPAPGTAQLGIEAGRLEVAAAR
jgi:hypothetical protein